MRVSYEGTIDEVIAQLVLLKERNSHYNELKIEEDYCGEGYTYDLYGSRLETDEEYESRLKQEAKYAAQHLEQKRVQYEALKKIFEPEN